MRCFLPSGADQVLRNLDQIIRTQPTKIAAALHEEAEELMTEAKRRTPVDTSALRSSGHVQIPQVDQDSVSVTLAFGGPAAPYAVYVHEDLTANHPVGQAKFLESVLTEAAPNLPARIARRVAGDLL
jgi:hypothetical protein